MLFSDTSKCCNFKQKQFHNALDSVYYVSFQIVSSHKICKFGHACQFIHQRETARSEREHNEFKECHRYLWADYLWHFLSGGHEPKFGVFQRYFEAKSGKCVRQAIPHSVQAWWIEDNCSINIHEPSRAKTYGLRYRDVLSKN